MKVDGRDLIRILVNYQRMTPKLVKESFEILIELLNEYQAVDGIRSHQKRPFYRRSHFSGHLECEGASAASWWQASSSPDGHGGGGRRLARHQDRMYPAQHPLAHHSGSGGKRKRCIQLRTAIDFASFPTRSLIHSFDNDRVSPRNFDRPLRSR